MPARSSTPTAWRCRLKGGGVQSANWPLKKAVDFDRAQVTSLDWSSYPILNFPEVPKVEVYLLDRPDEKFLGSGEASSEPAAAAIANAVGNATGRRLRDLPLFPERIRATEG